MKVLLLLGLVLVAAKSVTAAANDMGAVPSLENGMIRATTAYETFMQASYNESCKSCGCTGCCPVIVRNCAPKYVGSVIEGFSGWRGNAAIIVDWGCTEYNPCSCCKKGRLCTVNDIGFRWFIDWGDDSHDCGYQTHLGPFQKTHQYDKSCSTRSYGVTVYYCSDPGCCAERCCDTIYRVIDVNEDPGKGVAGIDFNKPLEVK